MRFTHIALDPNGVYIGRTENGCLWQYSPALAQWVILWVREKEPEN